MANYLVDKEFLKQLDESHNQERYARIISLTMNEEPIEQIEGRVTGGSINIDGTSAVRRTCSLQLVAQDVNINEFYWGLTHKFSLEIGVKNTINPQYPDIIWFKQGIYAITAFTTSLSATNYSISISGKDKMCFLNGDLGGNLPASVDFGCIDTYDTVYETVSISQDQYKAHTYYTRNPNNEKYTLSDLEFNEHTTYYQKASYSSKDKIPLKTIIREAVHTYGGELYKNIIINDLEDYGFELLEFRCSNATWYLPYNVNTGMYENIIMNNINVYDINTKAAKQISAVRFRSGIAGQNDGAETVLLDAASSTPYQIFPLSYGDTAGYRLTELTYAGDLISSIGETLTSILDKIKKMLNTFEYFYDTDGHFIFQKKRNYESSSWNTIVSAGESTMVTPAASSSANAYSFEDGVLITAFNNTPSLTNLKNDYVVWGQRTTSSGANVPIHARYAIDKKPTAYKSFDGHTYTTNDYDWREIIYQMAKDYYAHNQENNFMVQLATNNAALNNYANGLTGYEQYYVDMISFWRDIYDPDPPPLASGASGGYYTQVKEYVDDTNTSFHYVNKWIPYVGSTTYDYFTAADAPSEALKYWHKNVYDAPDLLNFWFDFLDTGELVQFSVPMIGDRAKVVNDNTVKQIYVRETPNIIYCALDDRAKVQAEHSGYTAAALDNYMLDYFTVSSQGATAKDRIDDLMYQYSYCSESVSITALPVYYLEPNTRIFVYDEKSNIKGEYLVSKFSLPLTYNGTMSITATKAVARIY